MKQRRLIVTALFALTTGLVLYNYWAYSCGRCTLASFAGLSPPAQLLLLCNLAALLVYAWLKLRRRTDLRQTCPCGSLLHRNWQYCPACGTPCHPAS